MRWAAAVDALPRCRSGELSRGVFGVRELFGAQGDAADAGPLKALGRGGSRASAVGGPCASAS
jgi:hypothetical protein